MVSLTHARHGASHDDLHPPGYEEGKGRYPVLYLLHGMGGDEEAWPALGRTAQILDNLIAEGKAEKMIVVMTNGNAIQQAAPGHSAEGLYKPQFQLPKTMESSFEKSFADVVKFVDKHYRTIAKREKRAIAGLSMGGFHALHISRTMPKTFDYVGLFSAATMKGKDKHFYDDMAETLQAQRDNGFELYWIGIGKEDFLWKMNVEFRKQLDAMENGSARCARSWPTRASATPAIRSSLPRSTPPSCLRLRPRSRCRRWATAMPTIRHNSTSQPKFSFITACKYCLRASVGDCLRVLIRWPISTPQRGRYVLRIVMRWRVCTVITTLIMRSLMRLDMLRCR